MPEDLVLKNILAKWGIAFRTVRGDMPISGSPGRSLRRFVVEDQSGSLFVLEKISLHQLSRRKEAGAVLAELMSRGLSAVQPYLPSESGEHFIRDGRDLYQIRHYVQGIELVRPGYIFDERRGIALADFLTRLKKAATPGLPLKDTSPFSVFAFIDDLKRKMRRFDADVLGELDDIIGFLNKNFREIHDRAPVVFCHGDFHPLNIVWSKDGIAAVIDWEFMGMKPDFYDVANMIGCVGFEDPDGLVGGLIRRFLATLYRESFLSAPSRKHLPEAVLASRLIWLSVWLAEKDRQMIELEVRYLKLISENIADLRYSWGTEF